MFDIGFWELAVIGTIMLIVLGPERLPGVARTAGFWLSKIRRMVSDVKTEVKREMDAAELKELDDAKNQIQEATKTVHQQMNKDILSDDDKKGSDQKGSDQKRSDDNKSDNNFADNTIQGNTKPDSEHQKPDHSSELQPIEKSTDDSGRS